MKHVYAFNGDADGLCALQQLRLGEAGGNRDDEVLVTGVKRDIALLARVPAQAGDRCTVLDVSLDVNRDAVMALLSAGVSLRYFDHHFAGAVPDSDNLEPHIDTSAKVCTAMLVDRHLQGRFRAWAAVGAFGDGLIEQGQGLARAAHYTAEDADRLRQLGQAINYNAYGETIADLHVAPVELAKEMLPFPDPLVFAQTSPTFARLVEGYGRDMELAERLTPLREVPGAILFVLPDAAWARRASGTLANDLARAHADCAVAIVSHKKDGGYLVSLRVPNDAKVSAEEFCRRFPSGGGRRTAAGINHLPSSELDRFALAFEQQYSAG